MLDTWWFKENDRFQTIGERKGFQEKAEQSPEKKTKNEL